MTAVKPVFWVDPDSLPALAVETADGKRFRATLDCCDGGCAVFVLGPREVDCVIYLCGRFGTACPKDDSVVLRVCVDCPAGPGTGGGAG